MTAITANFVEAMFPSDKTYILCKNKKGNTYVRHYERVLKNGKGVDRLHASWNSFYDNMPDLREDFKLYD